MVPPLRCADGTPIAGKWLAVSFNRAGFAFSGFKVRAETAGLA
jgi:hypothetical protein